MTRFVVRRKLLITVGWLVVAVPLFGQASAAAHAPAYDVISIKPNKSGSQGMRAGVTGIQYSTTNTFLKVLIQSAYNLPMDNLISGLPGWADPDRFDIEAKMDEETAAALKQLPEKERSAQYRLMMQSLLAERFGLKVHHESKVVPMYALIVAKGGFKLKDADPNGKSMGAMSAGSGQFTGHGVPIAYLVSNLAGDLHRLVVDQTGLTGRYDLTLQWAKDEIGNDSQDASAQSAGPSIFTALQEQLGLQLDSIKGPVDTIVVDHIEQPSEN